MKSETQLEYMTGNKNNPDDVQITPQKTTCEKVVETVFLVATWLALGLYLEIFGPTLIDLKIKLNTGYEDIAVAVSGRSFGLFPGCVIGGYLVDKFGKYCHLMLAVCLDFAAIATAIIPWSQNVELLWFLCFVGGFMESVINIAGQRLILKLWQEKAATPMILLHSGYGFGSFIIPLYANPFLAVKQEGQINSAFQHSNSTYLTTPSELVLNTTLTKYAKGSRIEYTYAISAILVALHSLSFYVYQVREHRYQVGKTGTEEAQSPTLKKNIDPDRSFLQMINPGTCAGGRMWYGVQVFALLFICFANANGGERLLGGFIRSFSVDQLGFSNSDASFINTTFWISFAVGRISFSIAAKWITVRILVLIQTGGLTITSILLAIFAKDNSTSYWVLVQCLGLFEAPLWPTFVAWTDYHLELTGMGMMVILLGGSVGGIGHQSLIGYLYEHFGPQMFLYQLLGYAILAFLLAVFLDIIGAQHGSRFSWDNAVEMVRADQVLLDNANENNETRFDKDKSCEVSKVKV
ncbi:sodium-dependent glucose transporter 1A-like [Ruditapes philippinarum]|uniref:sodium-dependent glucose transporter 1A-like n=1 Tax=Ruditapes philippinarum TaxID=129788 RepID=UPI00295B6B97|nr:sodium-dependent glucose transporter 1A-like [Ruditapes philippinarum]